MKRILHVVLGEYIDGYSYQENLLTQKQAMLGYEVYVITSNYYKDRNWNIITETVGDYINEYGVHVSRLQASSYKDSYFVLHDKTIGLYKKIEEVAPDIIFLHNFIFNDIRHIVKYVARHNNTKLFVDCHSDYYNNPINTIRGKIKALLARHHASMLKKHTVKFWGTTPWRVEYLQDVYKIPKKQTDLLIMGAEETLIISKNRNDIRRRVRDEYKIPREAFLVVTGGMLDKRKQQNLLCEAVKQMNSDNIYLILFGKPTPEMKPVFDEYSKCNKICFVGWADAEKSSDLFLSADLAFFPGTHSVLWEQAVASELPVVVRHWHGMEHVDMGGNAILLDDVNVENIKNTILNLTFTSKYYLMKEKAKQVASSFYLADIAKRSIMEN